MKASSRLAACCLSISCAGLPVASTRPACISETRSQRSASFMKWVEMKIVTPWFRARSASSSQNRSRASGSTPDVGSSRMSISGSCTTATARDSRCRMPRGRPDASSVDIIREAEPRDERGNPRLGLLARQVEEPRVQLEILPHRELGVEREGLRHVADAAAQAHVVGIDRSAEQRRLALARRQQAGQHLHRGRLAAAVRAEEAEDLAALDGEAHAVDRGEVAEAHGEVARHDRGPPSWCGVVGSSACDGRGAAPPAAAR